MLAILPCFCFSDGKTGDAGAAAVTSPSGRRSSRVRRSTSRALPGREETTAAAAAPVEAEPEAEPAPPTPPPAAGDVPNQSRNYRRIKFLGFKIF